MFSGRNVMRNPVMMAVFLLSCTLLSGSALAAWAQPPEPQTTATPPVHGQNNTPVQTSVPSTSAPSSPTLPVTQDVSDITIYRIFFSHVEDLDHTAEKLESEGKDAHDLRTHDQRLSGLTKDEGTLLKQIAYDCNRMLRDQKAKVHADIESYRAQQSNQMKPAWPPGEMAQAIADQRHG